MRHLKIFAVVLFSLLITSCNKNDDQVTGVGDVMIVAKQSGENIVYGISMYAYTLSSFESVTAVSTVETGKTYTLKANQGYKTNFYFETPETQFTATKPAAATFDFSATFTNGVKQDFQDILTDKVLPIPTLDKCEYDEIKHQLDMSWTLIADVASYSINIIDGDELVFGSTELKNNIKTSVISAAGTGWAIGFTPEAGKTYTVRLFAYMFEPGGDAYNIQAVSFVEKEVVWGN
jgi:predicted small secreted protein